MEIDFPPLRHQHRLVFNSSPITRTHQETRSTSSSHSFVLLPSLESSHCLSHCDLICILSACMHLACTHSPLCNCAAWKRTINLGRSTRCCHWAPTRAGGARSDGGGGGGGGGVWMLCAIIRMCMSQRRRPGLPPNPSPSSPRKTQPFGQSTQKRKTCGACS